MLLLRHTNVDAPVTLAPFVGVVARDGVLLAVTFGLDTGLIDAAADDRLARVFRARLREALIRRRVTRVVRVSAELHVHVRITAEDGGDVPDLGLRARRQVG